jgi:hypothetical protein
LAGTAAKVTDGALPSLASLVFVSPLRVLTVHNTQEAKLRSCCWFQVHARADLRIEADPRSNALTKTELATSKTHKQRRKEAAFLLPVAIKA